MSYDNTHVTPAISVNNVSKKFRLFQSNKERLLEALHPFRKEYHHEYWALKDISFEINKGEIVGILGKNGSGKSTLLQIICSIMKPTHGYVKVNGKISALLELGAGFNPEFTGRENAIMYGNLMGCSRQHMLEKIDAIEAFAEIGEFFDQPVKTYSSGMFVRVAFAAAIHIDPEILIVDEALSVGDSKFQHRCFQKIRSFMEQGKTILVVSHSTDALLRICNRGIVLNNGDLCYVGLIQDAVNCYHNILYGTNQEKDESQLENESTNIANVDENYFENIEDILYLKKFYNSHEVRLGNGKAKIIDMNILSNGVLNPFEIVSGADVELLVKLYFEEAMSNISVGFAIVSIEGLYVYGTNLHMMQLPLIHGNKSECVNLKFKIKANLVGNEYFFNLGCNHLENGEDIYIDIRRSVVKIKFVDTPSCIGVSNLYTQFEKMEMK